MTLSMGIRAAVAASAVIVVTGCSGGGSAGTSDAATVSPSDTARASAASSAAAASASASAAAATPTVDLSLSGPFDVALSGSAGQCRLGTDGNGTPTSFGFSATEADYPGLGDGLFIDESSGIVTVKWLSPSGGLLSVGQAAGVVSADHHSIALDTDLDSGTTPEHIAGTIVCP